MNEIAIKTTSKPLAGEGCLSSGRIFFWQAGRVLSILVHHGQQEHPGFTASGACLQHHVVSGQ